MNDGTQQPGGVRVRLLALSTSLRGASLHRGLVREAADIATANGAEVRSLDLRDLDVPLYDGDREAAEGLPAGVREVIDSVREADGVVIASPEYNHSVAGVTKNLLDWVSRGRPYPLQGKPVLALSATPGQAAGRAGLEALRQPLEAVGATVHTAGFGRAARRADGSVELPPADAARLEGTVRTWIEAIEAQQAVMAG